ncbi:hypothetical protein [Streptomyces sp. NPDC086023]|uniref:hypothetical protein n=1 Tax=Streptomyces sp. NPDC086023 TaxID=3365746 RepID=UPI0037D4D0BE
MQIRADVAELLRAGLADHVIAKQLHTDHKKVAAARAALRLPKVKSGVKPAASIEALFHSRTEPAEDGHLRWTGYIDPRGTPVLRYAGRIRSAYRVAFTIRTGREPVGYVRPACGMSQCVAPDHVDDRPAREKNKAAYIGIFGGAL